MAPGRSPAGRLLLPLLGMLAIVLLVWWPESAPPAEPLELDRPVVEQPEAADPLVAAAEDEPEPAAIERTEMLDEEGLPLSESAAVAAQQVAVRVWITTGDEEKPGKAPEDAAEWTAVAQTWLGDTDETFRWEVPFDERGMAAFVFDGPTHVDWFGAIPPESSVYGFDRYEGHDDYRAGSRGDIWLRVAPGGMLIGKVVDVHGRPVAGVPLDLMHDSGASLDFTPGFQRTWSEGDGSFAFGRLAAGETWSVAVPPGEWMMIDPTFDEIGYGQGMAEVSADPLPADAGTITVMPGASVAVDVVDSRGIGVPGVSVQATPTEYFTDLLRQPPDLEQVDVDPMTIFLSDAVVPEPAEAGAVQDGRIEDPYAWDYHFTTDRQGRAILNLSPGAYVLTLGGHPGADEEGEELRVPMTTAQRSLTIQLRTTLGEVRGQLLDEDDRPLARAQLYLGSNDVDREFYTDAEGRFTVERLPLEAEYWMEVVDLADDRDLVAHGWRPRAAVDGGEIVYRVQRGYDLPVLVSDHEGRSMDDAELRVVSWSPGGGTPQAVDPMWFEKVDRSDDTNRRGLAYFRGLLPGQVEVALLMPQGDGTWDSRGRPNTTLVEYCRWIVVVDGSIQAVTADLSGYAPPVSMQTEHIVRVRDAATGEPVGYLRVEAVVEGGRSVSRTNRRSDLSFDLRRGEVQATVLARGYSTWTGTWPETMDPKVEHVIHLSQEDSRLRVELQDRDGLPVPMAHAVRLEDLSGNPVKADIRPDNRYPRLGSQGTCRNGVMDLASVPAGPLVLRLDFYGYEGATARIDVPRAPGGATITAVLDHTLEQMKEQVPSTISEALESPPSPRW